MRQAERQGGRRRRRSRRGVKVREKEGGVREIGREREREGGRGGGRLEVRKEKSREGGRGGDQGIGNTAGRHAE